MPGEDKQYRNYKIVSRLLGFGGVIILLFSRRMAEPQKKILEYIAFAMIIGCVIQGILFYIKPGAFKNKSPNPDEESD
jgi:hypothetical protein